MADINEEDLLEDSSEALPEQFLRRGKLFSVVDVHTFSGTTFENKLLLRNPSGSGVNIIFTDIETILDLSSSIATLHDLSIAIYRNPTITTTGSVLTTSNKKSGQSDTSNLLVYQNPTISANGRLITGDVIGNHNQSHIKRLILEPGDDLLISMAISNTSDGAYSILEWAEDII